LVFRSISVAGKALLVNTLPLLAAFGVMGWLGVPLDAGTVLVGNLALGIAIDDSIHILAAHEAAGGRGDALDIALQKVLPAISATTASVALGFAVLGFSDFVFTRNLGILTSGIMLLCYFCDVLFLPALLSHRRPPRGA
jgi:predicted RND superfamily exporter protein